MKVLYFHQHFSTPRGSTGTRSYEMARALVAAGHEVTMICGTYNGGVSGLSEPFLRGKRSGMVDGIQVVELELIYSNYQSFTQRSWIFLKFAWQSILIALRDPCDLIFATTTPLTACLPGICARWLRGKRFIFEVRDLWPELPKAMGVITNPVILGLMSLLEWLSYRSAHADIGLSPGIVEGIKKRSRVGQPVAMIPNGCDLELFSIAGVQPLRPDGVGPNELMAVFTGAHGQANGLDAVIKTAEELKRRGRKDIKLVFIGDGKLKPVLQREAEEKKLDNCIFLDPVPKDMLAAYMKGADLGLMILANIPAFYYGTSPNKFFDYLAIGLPVLNNYPGWLAGMIEENECGYVVEPDNAELFADALEDAADHPEKLKQMGVRAQSLGKSQFDRKKLAVEFVTWLEKAGRSEFSPFQETVIKNRVRVKRCCDLLLAIVGGVILAPVIVLTALLVHRKIGSPLFFRQTRPGLNGKPFKLIKFRTMLDAIDKDGNPLPDDQRMTPFGKFLRASSLDELPELWNVLKGDMSLVGPRPLLMEYLPLYNDEQRRRHEARPGITGWAQINGRNSLSWDERFRLDIWYVDNQSFWLDLKILFMTVRKVLVRDGISADGEATMSKFTGQDQRQDEH